MTPSIKVEQAPSVQYLLRLWRDPQRNSATFEAASQPGCILVLGDDVLKDGDFWWDVVAVDAEGNARVSAILKMRPMMLAIFNVTFSLSLRWSMRVRIKLCRLAGRSSCSSWRGSLGSTSRSRR